MMRVLVVGNDVRSVALARALRRERVAVGIVPGLASPSLCPDLCTQLAPLDTPAWAQVRRVEELIRVVTRALPDLVVLPHVESSDAGLVDQLKVRGRRLGFDVFGVSREASRLETSKWFGIEVARRAGLAVPRSEFIEHGRRASGTDAVRTAAGALVVVKEDGLAGGRGTRLVPAERLAATLAEPEAGARVLQEYVPGAEVALSLMCRGRAVALLNVNFEYKREHEGDQGANTPGMGTIARNARGIESALGLLADLPDVLEELDYVGPLDVSFMLEATTDRPVFLEFTARYGDPELSSEVLLARDWAQLLVENARNLPPRVRYSRSLWAAGVVARGGRHRHLRASFDTLGASTHDSMSLPAGDESVYSVAGHDYRDALSTAYGHLADSASDEAVYRRDVGHDVAERWAGFERARRVASEARHTNGSV